MMDGVMKKWIMLGTMCLLLLGCGSGFIYRHLDWFVIDYIDDYVDLTDAQEDLISQQVSTLSLWFARDEIPLYITHLDTLLTLDPKTFSITMLRAQRHKIETYTQRIFRKLIPEATSLAAGLTEKQVHQLMQALQKQRQQYKKKFQHLTVRELRDYYKDRITDNLEVWLGALTSWQTTLVKAWVDSMYVMPEAWIAYQGRIDAEVKSLLEQRQHPAQFSAHLQQLLFQPEHYFSENLQTIIDHNQQVGEPYVVKIVQTMTPEQIEHFRHELKDWRKIATEIQSQEAPTRVAFSENFSEK